ncbi:hypothetical protein ACUWC2_28445, partial [Klebsiella pneumoniae]|uniref:hypothetical protein n=1 Tax=Klebsiella pneumoniae TaxID=573 RepID=UPI004055884A
MTGPISSWESSPVQIKNNTWVFVLHKLSDLIHASREMKRNTYRLNMTQYSNDGWPEGSTVMNGDLSILEEEVEKAIGGLKRKKAPGSDNIPNELILEAKDILIKPLCLLFNRISY